MRYLVVVCFAFLASSAQAAEIAGAVRLLGAKSVSVTVGYAGKGADGSDQSNMCGTRVVTGGSGWVQCDTFKPRLSRLEFDARNGCRFRHWGLLPGRYLVYVRAGEHWYDLSWVTVKSAKDVIKLDFRLNPADCGTVEALVSGGGPSEVICEPVDARQKPVLAGVNALFWLNAEQKPEGGRVVYSGLKPGAYIIRYGRAKAVFKLGSGQRLRMTIKG